jgi:hypothetical protein
VTFARVATAVARGLVSGLVGTAAMTLSSTVEMNARKRPPSKAPAKAVETILEVEPKDKAAEERLSTLVHWGYGTAWGAARGMLDVIGLNGPAAAIAHFAAVWGAAMVMLPAVRAAPPPTEWGTTELAIDGFHHVVYASATSAAYEALARAT